MSNRSSSTYRSVVFKYSKPVYIDIFGGDFTVKTGRMQQEVLVDIFTFDEESESIT
jgi:hypothetical protein